MAKRLFDQAKPAEGRLAALPFFFKDDRMSALLEAARLASGAAADDDVDGEIVPALDYWEGVDDMAGDEDLELEMMEADASLALRATGASRRSVPSSKKAPKRGKGRPAKLIPGGPCDCCRVRWSPQWRKPKEDETVLCNACGIYFTRHGKYPEHRMREAGAAGKRWQDGGESEEGSHDEAFMHAHPVRASRSCDSTHVNLTTESPEDSGADVLNPGEDAAAPKVEPSPGAPPAVQPKAEPAPGHLSDSDPSPSEGSSFTPHTRKRIAVPCLESSSPSKFSKSDDLPPKLPTQARDASLLLQLATSAGRGPVPSSHEPQQVLLEKRPARRTRKVSNEGQPGPIASMLQQQQQFNAQSAEPVKTEEQATVGGGISHNVPGLPPLTTALNANAAASLMQNALLGNLPMFATQPLRMLQTLAAANAAAGKDSAPGAAQGMVTTVHQLMNGPLLQHLQQQQLMPTVGDATGRTSSTSGGASTNSATPTPGNSVPVATTTTAGGAVAQGAQSAPSGPATAIPSQPMFFLHRPGTLAGPGMQFTMPGQPHMAGLTYIRPPSQGPAAGDQQQPQMHPMGTPIFMWAPPMAGAQQAQQHVSTGGAGDIGQRQMSTGGVAISALGQPQQGGLQAAQQQPHPGPKLVNMLPGGMSQLLSAAVGNNNPGVLSQPGGGGGGGGVPGVPGPSPMFASLMSFPMRGLPMGQMMMMAAANGALMAPGSYLQQQPQQQQQPVVQQPAQNAA